MERVRNVLSGLGWIAVGLLCMSSVSARSYPSKPIRFIIPFGAGTVTDQAGRFIGRKIAETLGQAVIVAAPRTPEAVEFFGRNGWDPVPGTPQELGTFVRSEIEKWGSMIKVAGIEAE
jgi:tripartite-type tricarboxylate transporter receptor subunit TctC